MNILSKVTMKTLVKNKVRSIVTIIGIILSAAMITAVTTSVSSFMTYLQRLTSAQDGLWHGVFYNMPSEDRARLDADERVDSAVYAQVMGWHDTSEGNAGGYIYIFLLGVKDDLFERMPVDLTAGRLPENPGEILLSDRLRGTEKGEYELGDTVTLDLGDRYLDGELLDNRDYYESGEELIVRESRTYTVVGFMRRSSFAGDNMPGDLALTRWDEDEDAAYLQSYFLLKDPRQIYDFMEEFSGGRFGYGDNNDYLTSLGVSKFGTFYSVMDGLAAILIGLIMFGSVSLIYNSFSISVAERTKQFGLLRSVGATKRQIRSMVFTEAAAVSAVGIPLGIISGILGMTVTFHFIGKPLEGILGGGGNEDLRLVMYVTPMSVILAAAIGLVTVLISAWAPSRRAMRISAIEAIRQSGDVRISRREVKISPLTYKLFGLEGVIAAKHFKRDRKRYRATVVSLFMSVVLFISASSFCRYITDSVHDVYEDYDYDIQYTGFVDRWDEQDGGIGSENMEKIASVLSKAPSVTESSAMISFSGSAFIPLEDIPDSAVSTLGLGDDNASGTYTALEAEDEERPGLGLTIHIFGVEDGTYREYLRSHGLPEEEYMGEGAKIIVRPVSREFNRDTQRMESIRLLRDGVKALNLSFTDELAWEEFMESEEAASMTDYEIYEAEESGDFTVSESFEIGYMTDELPFGLNGGNAMSSVTVLMSRSDAARFAALGRYDNWCMYFGVGDKANGLSHILDAAGEAELGLDRLDFYDLYERAAGRRGIVTAVNVISRGFIALISAIASVNVFNTVSTNILLRRRELAMLRSVGMTNKGFNKMMNYECLLYGTKALALGIPCAFAVTYLIFRTVTRALDVSFYLPWGAVGIAVGSVFLVVFLSMMYSMAGIKRDDPVEAMKNEVI